MKKRSIVPTLAVLCGAVVLPVSFSTAQTTPGTPEVSLAGQYVFFLSGQEQIAGGGTELIGIGGSVTADSNGNITAGIVDKNSSTGYISTQTVSGSYQIGATGKGSFNLVTPSGTIGFVFYEPLPLNQGPNATRGSIVAGTGTILQASGEIGPASGSFTPINGNEYDAFVGNGEADAGTGSYVTSGTLHFVQAASSPSGTLGGSVTASSNFVANGASSSVSGLVGTYTGPSQEGTGQFAGPGRFTMQFPLTLGSSAMAHFVVYAGNFETTKYFFLTTDAHPASPLEVSSSVRLQNFKSGPNY